MGCAALAVVVAVSGLLVAPRGTGATVFAVDFLAGAHVRTDPLVDGPDSIGCLSDHVHTFYGAVDRNTVRPDASFTDLRRPGLKTTANIKENKSLYWHPAIYRRTRDAAGQPKYVLADQWFSSVYYEWGTGNARAYPEGFKMKVRSSSELSFAEADCVFNPDPEARDFDTNCKRADGACGRAPGQDFLPTDACYELELKIQFPTCWDGVRLTSPDGMSHVAFTDDGAFDGQCPASHPVRLPQLQFVARLGEYPGGEHVFSDEAGGFHADFFSGWKEDKLQKALDECENFDVAALPEAFCADHHTFLGDLEAIQPRELQTQCLVSPEEVNNVPELPRGACSGTLLPRNAPAGDCEMPTPTPDDEETEDEDDPDEEGGADDESTDGEDEGEEDEDEEGEDEEDEDEEGKDEEDEDEEDEDEEDEDEEDEDEEEESPVELCEAVNEEYGTAAGTFLKRKRRRQWRKRWRRECRSTRDAAGRRPCRWMRRRAECALKRG